MTFGSYIRVAASVSQSVGRHLGGLVCRWAIGVLVVVAIDLKRSKIVKSSGVRAKNEYYWLGRRDPGLKSREWASLEKASGKSWKSKCIFRTRLKI